MVRHYIKHNLMMAGPEDRSMRHRQQREHDALDAHQHDDARLHLKKHHRWARVNLSRLSHAYYPYLILSPFFKAPENIPKISQKFQICNI